MKKLLLIASMLFSSISTSYADENNTIHGKWKVTGIIVGGKTLNCSIASGNGPASILILYNSNGDDPSFDFSLNNENILPSENRTINLSFGSNERKITFDYEKNYAPKGYFTVFKQKYNSSNMADLLANMRKASSIQISGDFIKNKGWLYTTNSFNFSSDGFNDSIDDLLKCIKSML